MILKRIKHFFIFLLTFLLGAQATYAKTELILPIKSVSFTIEQNQSFKSLEKEVQPNIGFLKEKSKFEVSESISALNTCNFSKEHLCYLAKAVGKQVTKLNLGKRIGKLGKYEIFEQGEVFYRAIPKSHLDDLKKIGEIKVPYRADGTTTAEIFTSPTLEYIKKSGYLDNSVIIKFKMKPGTLEELKTIGTVKKSDIGKPLMNEIGTLPVNSKGWMKKNTLFKIEGTDKGIPQVNIGLGRDGKGMEIFNNNILEFEIIK